jgi:hypothetical protein
VRGAGVTLPRCIAEGSGQISKDDVNGFFSSASDVCFEGPELDN